MAPKGAKAPRVLVAVVPAQADQALAGPPAVDLLADVQPVDDLPVGGPPEADQPRAGQWEIVPLAVVRQVDAHRVAVRQGVVQARAPHAASIATTSVAPTAASGCKK
jgi:hypothetical protein